MKENKYVIINQQIIDYIKNHRQAFEMDLPEIGDKWTVDGEKTYLNVNGGKPVLELSNEEGMWMRLPKSIVANGRGNRKHKTAVMRLSDIPVWVPLKGEEKEKWGKFWKFDDSPVITKEDDEWWLFDNGYKISVNMLRNLPKG